MKVWLVLLIVFAHSLGFSQERPVVERDYQIKFCEQVKGIMEVRLLDATRVDCLTEEYAIEVEYARKWAEAVGQSLHYAIMTGKKPGIALILKNKMEEEAYYYNRVKNLADKYDIRVWKIYEGFLGTIK